MEQQTSILPVSMDEVKQLGWERPDFILVTGDAYIDHPSFGTAIISRVLENAGYRVAILAQPNWHNTDDFMRFGRPRLGFLVNSGNIDSMVNHYTAQKRTRRSDAYTPGGRAGARPDRAVIVYANRIREAYKRMPVVIGGIEASLRRFAHYDYWDDRVRRSILIDSCADLLIYGMGERPILDIAEQLEAGVPVQQICNVAGTAFIADQAHVELLSATVLPTFDEVRENFDDYNEAFLEQQKQAYDPKSAILAQQNGRDFVVVNPPTLPLSREEMDDVYALPYTRRPHPNYTEAIPALDEIMFSVSSCRGCFGSCSFCALTYHQGRVVTSRSHESILNEVEQMTEETEFKGYIHDVGGPTANFRHPACKKQEQTGSACLSRQCLHPKPCEHLDVSHQDYTQLLKKLRAVPKVKKVFIRSGLRYDYILYDRNSDFFNELVEHHISGQLKIAPEHIDDRVLDLMGKPSVALYERFVQKYKALNQKMGKEQYIVPYFMSSHPGSDLTAAITLAQYMKKNNIRPEQVQDFYPTPGTLATAMFFTGKDPRTGKAVYVPRQSTEKKLQRALLQYYRSENAPFVREALKKAHREDLIGFDKDSLVRPDQWQGRKAKVGQLSYSTQNNHKKQPKPAVKQKKKRVRQKSKKRFD